MDTVVGTRIVVGLLLASLILVGVWDVFLALQKITADTPSDVILIFLSRYPVIACAFGVILGHLLWPQYR